MNRTIKHGLYFGLVGPLFGNLILCVGWGLITCFANSCTNPSVYTGILGMGILGLFFCHLLGGIPAILTGIAVGLFPRNGVPEIVFAATAGFLFTLGSYSLAIGSPLEATAPLFGLVGALAGLATICFRNRFKHLTGATPTGLTPIS
jgi:hypothetical protein